MSVWGFGFGSTPETQQKEEASSWLDSSSSLQILLDLCCVLAIGSVDLAIESHVPFVDEVNVSASLLFTLATVTLTLLAPFYEQ